MPRVKAMTTGSIPSFLDVILNFAESDTSSSLAGQDSWLAQMRALNKGSLLMYGDDTWLKLFPGFFSRKDGTSSFFVSDFTEVDKNVTRHYPAELLRSDWNTLIMHYLGLDHIGHKAGPRSPNMPPKQAEMDQIVRDIYHALESQVHLQSTLFVLCGDHGMNDAGNHGGSAPGETSPALVFISPKLKEVSDGVECPTEAEDGFNFYTTIEQSDLVPTLAGLLGFPVPMNNLGVFIPSFLTFWKNDSDRLDLLFKNSQQILELVKATFPSVTFDGPIDPAKCTNPSSDLDNLACRWGKVAQFMDSRRHHQNNGAAESMANLTEFSKLAQEIMSSTASSYNLLRLKAGIAITAMATCLAATALVGVLSEKSVGLSLVTIALTYGGMMFASSYVEEEQHFWYWSASSCVAYICIKELRTTTQNKSLPGWKSLAVLVALRLYRRWNQTGQKHAGEVDIARSFFPKHSLILWLAVIATYIYIALRVTGRNFRLVSFGSTIAFSVLLSLTALWFKMAFTFADAPELFGGLPQIFLKQLTSEYLLTQARVIFLGLSLAATYTAIFEIDRLRTSRLRTPPGELLGFTMLEEKLTPDAAGTWTLHYVLTLFLMTQSRAANIPLYLLFESQLYFLRRLDLSSIEISMTSIISQYMSFFAFGGSNSISSVDLSNAYNGVSGYSVVAVGVLTFVSNWAAPICNQPALRNGCMYSFTKSSLHLDSVLAQVPL
ncbi:MAG: hypothetical protein M1812_003856 [Candelaria pacifica]|nr:MAG: hypothetical protein M1812_003856 [Candelaria pacifica]